MLRKLSARLQLSAARRAVDKAEADLLDALELLESYDTDLQAAREWQRQIEEWDTYDHATTVSQETHSKAVGREIAQIRSRPGRLKSAEAEMGRALSHFDRLSSIARGAGRQELVQDLTIAGQLALDSFSITSGSPLSLLLWPSARGLEAGLRCGCQRCIARTLVPQSLRLLLLAESCDCCAEHVAGRFLLADAAESLVNVLKLGECAVTDLA